MHSAIYSGYIWHHRHLPRTHKFKYRVFMMYLDLAELNEVLAKSRWWSVNRFYPARFCRSDYFIFPVQKDKPQNVAVTEHEPSQNVVYEPATVASVAPEPHAAIPEIDESVRAAVECELGIRPSGAIRVLTNFRYFGYLINPISCYYCFDEADRNLVAVLIEVTNTPWGERTHYVLDLRQYQSGQVIDFDKSMHVSPFMPMRMIYRWKGAPPGQRLSYSLTSFMITDNGKYNSTKRGRDDGVGAEDRQFDSGVKFKRIEITSRSLGKVLLNYPWMTGKVALAIYWQALRLWLKRIPFVPHPDRLNSVGK